MNFKSLYQAETAAQEIANMTDNRILKSIQADIERLQAEYRQISSLNNSVIRGAMDTSEISTQIHALITQYNNRARRTQYYGGVVVMANTLP